jgi:hypothetical protein
MIAMPQPRETGAFMGKKARIFTYALGGTGLAAVVAAVAIVASPAMSGGMPGHGHGDGHGYGHGEGRMFLGFAKEMDADDSGSLTRTEIEAFNAARAAEIDGDKDGQVTVDELQAFHDAQRRKRMTEHLTAMDSDGDGKVTVAELQAASTWKLARLDRDGDGIIELRGHDRHRGHGPDSPEN